jgi:hypothetical protein
MMCNGVVILVLGSLQPHAAVVNVVGGGNFIPCLGTTDFGLPKLVIEYDV